MLLMACNLMIPITALYRVPVGMMPLHSRLTYRTAQQQLDTLSFAGTQRWSLSRQSSMGQLPLPGFDPKQHAVLITVIIRILVVVNAAALTGVHVVHLSEHVRFATPPSCCHIIQCTFLQWPSFFNLSMWVCPKRVSNPTICSLAC